MMTAPDERYPELERWPDAAARHLASDLERIYTVSPAPASVYRAIHDTAQTVMRRPVRRRGLAPRVSRSVVWGLTALIAAALIGGGAYAGMLTLTNRPGDEIMISMYRDAPPAFKPAGPGRVVGRVQKGDVGFILVVYPLRHAAPGCTGFVGLPLAIENGRWHDRGYLYGTTCLSANHPMDNSFLSASTSARGNDTSTTFLAWWVRALPTVKSLRLTMPGGRVQMVSVHDGAYLAFDSPLPVTVRALDASGHVIGTLRPHVPMYPHHKLFPSS